MPALVMESFPQLLVYLTLAISAIVVLLAISAFFSSSETAFTAASKARMHQLEVAGDKRAKWINLLLRQRERVIASILLGNNFVNILASSIATVVAVNALGTELGVPIATGAMTLFVVVFAEVWPKSWAIRNPDAIALRFARPMRWCVYLLTPITWFIRQRPKSATESGNGDENDALEEVRDVIELHHHTGDVVKDDRDMLRGILDLKRISVGDVMVHRKNVAMLDIGSDIGDAIEEIKNAPVSRMPVYENDPDNVIGILHAREIRRLLREKNSLPNRQSLREAVHEVWFVPETASLDRQLRAFLKRRSHFAMVVDEYGSIQGIITLSDILEEVFGDIDENTNDDEFVSLPDGGVQVDGQTSTRDLNRRMNWNLPDEEAATVAGLVITRSQMLPSIGYALEANGYLIEVVDRSHNRLTSLAIRPIAT